MFGFRRRVPRTDAAGASKTPAVCWDVHSHILPGVDDGVRTTEDALAAVRGLIDLGYRGSVVTPHIYKGLYPNSRGSLQPVAVALRDAILSAGLSYDIVLAAEYFADESLLELVQREPLLSFGSAGAPMVLIEYPYATEPLLWADVLTAVSRAGYVPVLAHVERYRFVVEAPGTWLPRFAHFGVKLQCNIGSLVGQYGPAAAKFARQMRDDGDALFWGTDLHRPKQLATYIRSGLTHLAELGQLNAALTAPTPIADAKVG